MHSTVLACIKLWSNHTSCPNLNGWLVELPLKLGYGWVIKSQKPMKCKYPCHNLRQEALVQETFDFSLKFLRVDFILLVFAVFEGVGTDQASCPLNSLRPRQNYRHFADDIFKCIFLNENVWISLTISLKFLTQFWINNITALVEVMARWQAIIWTNDG